MCVTSVSLYVVSVLLCLMEYKSYSLQQACEKVVMDKLVRLGGEGGLIAVDVQGNIAMPFNSEGMYRACKTSNKKTIVAIYKDEVKAVS